MKGKKKLIIALCVILGLLLVAVISFAAFTVYTAYSVKNSSSPVGYWVVTKAESNGVAMTPEDADAMGYDGIGSFTLNKSGSCKVVMMGEEYEGSWKTSKGKSLVINCGKGHVFNATIDKNAVMKATDESYIVYYLEK